MDDSSVRIGSRVSKRVRVRVRVGKIREVGKIGARVRRYGDDAVMAVNDGGAAGAKERPLDAAERYAGSGAAGLALSCR